MRTLGVVEVGAEARQLLLLAVEPLDDAKEAVASGLLRLREVRVGHRAGRKFLDFERIEVHDQEVLRKSGNKRHAECEGE